MKNKVVSALWTVIPFILGCVVAVHLVPISATSSAVLAAVLFVYSSLMTLSWSNSKRAQQLQCNPYSYKGTKANIVKIAICISSPFYFCLMLLALFPVQHYSIWLLIFIPTMIMFSLPLVTVADFCKEFRLSMKLFWGMQFLIQLSSVGIGRVFARLLMRHYI